MSPLLTFRRMSSFHKVFSGEFICRIRDLSQMHTLKRKLLRKKNQCQVESLALQEYYLGTKKKKKIWIEKQRNVPRRTSLACKTVSTVESISIRIQNWPLVNKSPDFRDALAEVTLEGNWMSWCSDPLKARSTPWLCNIQGLCQAYFEMSSGSYKIW